MDLRYTAEDQEFRSEVRQWMADNLVGEFAPLVGVGGPGSEHDHVDLRLEWEKHLGSAGWIGVGWPRSHGGREASLVQQVVFHEEYAAAGGPARLDHISEHLLAPTLIAFGSPEQCQRHLPEIRAGRELWCQGYSEPGAGSDLANISTRAHRDGDQWRINGQKIWTSLAHIADWCFVLARTEDTDSRHQRLSYLLVPMRQEGITIRPIRQLTGTSEFNEVFFDDAVTDVDNVVGEPGEGWRVAMHTLEVERGVSTLDQQLAFRGELDAVIAAARETGAIDDPQIAERIERAWTELVVLRQTALRMLGGPDGRTDRAPLPGPTLKLLWAPWHRRLGELAIDVLHLTGTVADDAPYELSRLQRLYLYTRADTIYGGSDEIQRTIIAGRGLGLPR